MMHQMAVPEFMFLTVKCNPPVVRVPLSLTPILTGVGNITVSLQDDFFMAEAGSDLQIVVIDNQGGLYPIAQLEGHDDSEITGVAFSPDGKRLYFSSQRGTTGLSKNGVSYEIQGF